MNKTTTPIALKFVDQGAGIIEGYASTFGPPADRVGDVVMPGAFGDQTLVLPLLAYHDATKPIGQATLTPDAHGLKMVATLANTEKAQEIRTLTMAGAIPGISIGYAEKATEPNDTGGKNLFSVDLMEVSLVPIPCNARALVTAAKSFGYTATTGTTANVSVSFAKAPGETNLDMDEDPGSLAQAVDAAIDEAIDAFNEGNPDQALALLVAADTTIDALLELLGVPDADDPKSAKVQAKHARASSYIQSAHDMLTKAGATCVEGKALEPVVAEVLEQAKGFAAALELAQLQYDIA